MGKDQDVAMTSSGPRRVSRVRTTMWYLVIDLSTLLYSIGSAILVTPITIRFVPVALYGAWLASGNILAWLGAVDPGITTALSQQLSAAFGRKDREEIGALTAAGLLFNSIIAITIGIAGFAVIPFLTLLLHLLPALDIDTLLRAARFAVVNTTLLVMSYGFFAVVQGLQFAEIGILYACANFLGLFSQVAFLFLGFGLMSIPYAGLLRALILVVGGLAYMMRVLRIEGVSLRRDTAVGRALIRSTSFIFSARILETIAVNVDAFAVGRFVGPEHVPMLKFTRTPIDAMHMFAIRPSVAITPGLSHLYATNDVPRTREIVRRLLQLSAWVAIFIGVSMMVFNSSFVGLWVGTRFFAGNWINMALCLGFVFNAITANHANVAFALGGVASSSVSRAVQSAFTLAVALVGAKYFGMAGVAIAPLCGVAVFSLWYLPSVVQGILRFDGSERIALASEIAKGLLSAAVVWIATYYLGRPTTWISLIGCGTIAASVFMTTLATVSKAFRTELWKLRTAVLRRLVRRGAAATPNG